MEALPFVVGGGGACTRFTLKSVGFKSEDGHGWFSCFLDEIIGVTDPRIHHLCSKKIPVDADMVTTYRHEQGRRKRGKILSDFKGPRV